MTGLRERAARRGRSVQQEVREILHKASVEHMEAPALPPLHLVTVRAGSASTWSRDDMYADDGAGR